MNNEELLGALARGYCTKRNSQKVLDPDLIQDMAKEVEKLTPLEPIDEDREVILTGFPTGCRCSNGEEEFKTTIKNILKYVDKFGVSNKLKPLDTCKYAVISHGIGISGKVEEIRVHCKMNTEVDYKETFGSPTKKEE